MKKTLSVLFALLLCAAVLCSGALPVFADEAQTYTVGITVPNGCAAAVLDENASQISHVSMRIVDESRALYYEFKLPAGLYSFRISSASLPGDYSIHFRVHDDGIAQTAEYEVTAHGVFSGPYLAEPNAKGDLNSDTVYAYQNGVLTISSNAGKDAPCSVNSEAFADMELIRKVIFDGNFSSINESAFLGCTGLEEVVFTEGTTVGKIGAYAFAECPKLTVFNLPHPGSTEIDETAFEGTPVEGTLAGSVLSEGALWIVIAVAAVAIIAVIGLIIWKKRKKVA